jgi:succinyl-diaminopimelate desuccinylase
VHSKPSPATTPTTTSATNLDLYGDVADLTATLMDIESVSGNERALADAIESALRKIPSLQVHRDGDSLVARTTLGRAERVILAGHLDTVPLPTTPDSRGTVPSTWDGETLYGRGATDMKGGVAVQLALAATLSEPNRDITFIFYDHEEVEGSKSGLGRLARNNPELLVGDFAILLEPTNGTVEGGCNGTSRYKVRTKGVAAHSARAWMGENAIHAAAPILQILAAYQPRTVNVDGLEYRESMNAVRINGGIAGNVIPDACEVEVNYRFAPDKDVAAAGPMYLSCLPGSTSFAPMVPAVHVPDCSTPSLLPLWQRLGRHQNPNMVGQT